MVQGHKRGTVNTTVVGLIPNQGNKIINIFIFLAVITGNRSAVLSFATQHAMPGGIWRKIGDESVLMGTKFLNTRIRRSLRLSRYERDTA